MIIEIDGYLQSVMLTGRKCIKKQLKEKYLKAKKHSVDGKSFPELFCRMHHFDKVPYDSEIEVDFVIDTDTDRIYQPSY